MRTEELFAAVWALPEITNLPEGHKAGVRHFQAAYESKERMHPDFEPHWLNGATLEHLLGESGVLDSDIPTGTSEDEFLDGIVVAHDAITRFVGNIIDGPKNM